MHQDLSYLYLEELDTSQQQLFIYGKPILFNNKTYYQRQKFYFLMYFGSKCLKLLLKHVVIILSYPSRIEDRPIKG